MSDSNGLALVLSNLLDFVPATMGLYEGRLVKNETELFFIAERFSGWEIMERCERSDVQKVEVSESFMGVVVEIHTNGSHWSLKDIPETKSVEDWLTCSEQPVSDQIVDDAPQDVESETSELNQTPALDLDLSQQVESAPTVKSEPVESVATQPRVIHPQSADPQVNQLRQILMDRPELKSKVKNAVGSHVDPLDEDVLSLFMRRHIQAYLEIRVASGEVLSPFEMFKVVQAQVSANPGGPIFLKILKGFIVMFVVLFVLPILFGVLSAVFSILDIIF